MKLNIIRLMMVCCVVGGIVFQVNTHAGEAEDKSLWASTIDGSLEGMAMALKDGASSNARSKHGMTPLMWAAQDGNLAMAKLLVENGADVNALHGTWGCTVLGFAAGQMYPQVVRYLIEHGASTTERPSATSSPLLKAVRNRIDNEDELEKLKEVVEDLVSNGADINFRNRKKQTPLMLAARSGKVSIVRLLLDKGANINDGDRYGNTALMHASIKGQLSVVELLLTKGADMSKSHLCGCTALLLASEAGHSDVAELLLDNGSDINAKNEDGMTALMFAAKHGHIKTIELLLRHEVRINELNNAGKTARMLAVEFKQDEAEDLLHEAGGRCF